MVAMSAANHRPRGFQAAEVRIVVHGASAVAALQLSAGMTIVSPSAGQLAACVSTPFSAVFWRFLEKISRKL
jgi:hypothetical protein